MGKSLSDGDATASYTACEKSIVNPTSRVVCAFIKKKCSGD